MKCPACPHEGRLTDLPYRNYCSPGVALFDSLKLALCDSCGLGWATPSPEPKLLRDYYERTYYQPGTIDYFDPREIRYGPAYVDVRSLSQVLLARPFLKSGKISRFLDVGAGSGGSFHTVRHLWTDARLHAVEANEDIRRMYERCFEGICIFQSTAELSIPNQQPMDAIFMSHSLEHFDAGTLIPEIRKLLSLLGPEGVLMIEVPNVDLRTHHARMRLRDDPHLCFFSREALSTLLQTAGFKVRFVETCGEEYKDWWTGVNEARFLKFRDWNEYRQHSGRASLGMGTPLTAARYLPTGLRSMGSKLRNVIQRLRQDPSQAWYRKLAAPPFCYGGDRTLLRAVATR